MRLIKTLAVVSLLAILGLSRLNCVDAIVRTPIASEISTFKKQ